MLLLNYKDTAKGAPESRWSEANKQAFLKAVKGGVSRWFITFTFHNT